jgi:hypothetical protein
MRRKRRTEITFQTKERLVLRQRRSPVRVWCEGCGQQTQMITAEAAAVVAGVSRRTIYRWAETEKLHFTETSDGLLLVCLNSLPK